MADDRAELAELRRLEELEARAAATQQPSTGQRLLSGLFRGGPLGLAVEGTRMGMEGMERASDAAGGAVVDFLSKPMTDEASGVTAPPVSPETAAAVGTAVKMAPDMILGAVTGGTAWKPAMEFAAKRTMQSALKPTSKAVANGTAAKAINTMLEEGVSATPGGAVKLRMAITKLKGELGQVISQQPGALVDKAHVYRELSKTLDDVSKEAGSGASRDAVLKAWRYFENHPLLQGNQTHIPAGLADEMKRATQRAVKDSYGRLTTTPADDKAQMAIASGLRQGIEEAVPGTGAINAKLSEYINALHQIEPKAAIQANKDLGGLVPLANSPEAAMLMLADRNPWMKSMIARVLYRGRTAIPTGAGAITGANMAVDEK